MSAFPAVQDAAGQTPGNGGGTCRTVGGREMGEETDEGIKGQHSGLAPAERTQDPKGKPAHGPLGKPPPRTPTRPTGTPVT